MYIYAEKCVHLYGAVSYDVLHKLAFAPTSANTYACKPGSFVMPRLALRPIEASAPAAK